jgi:VWFA-related protein
MIKRLMSTYLYIWLISFVLSSFCLYGDSVQTEEHDVTVRLILVDVIALDKKGNFVQDLKKEDFEVFADGKKMTINSLDLFLFDKEDILSEDVGLPKPVAVPPRKKRFIVIFDSVNTIQRMLDRSKATILEKLIELIRQGREIMVFEMTEKEGMKILQPFTSDETLIAQAVDKASGSIWVEKSADSLAVPSVKFQLDPALAARGLTIHPSAASKSMLYMYEYETRNRFEKSINSLLAVMNIIKDYPGRKPVLLISGGFPALSFAQVYAGDGTETNIPLAQVSAAEITDPFKVLHKTARRGGDEIFRDMIQYANSYNITFYTMDPDNYLRYVLPDMSYDNFPRKAAGLSSLWPDGIAEIKKNEMSNLKSIAKDTSGVSLLGSRKFDNFVKSVSRDLGNYYELSFYPRAKNPDGKYHKIAVKVKRPDVDITFRKGYFDYTGEQKESLLLASASYNPSIFKEIAFEARANTFIKGKDKYIFWFNVALPVKNIEPEDFEQGRSKVYKLGIWIDELGGDSALKSDMAIPIVLPPSLLERLRDVPFFGFNFSSNELKLKSDKYKLVFALYDEGNSRMGTVEHELTKPFFKSVSDLQLATVVFGNLVKSSRKGGFKLSEKDGTLQLKGYKLYPLGLNIFKPRKDVALFVQLYSRKKEISLEPKFPIFQKREQLGVIPARIVDRLWDKGARVWNCVYSLDFSGVPRGEYDLELKWSDSQVEQKPEERIHFRII